MRLQPIVYTTDPGRMVKWYSAVLGTEPSYRSEAWTTFEVGDATLAVHMVDQLPEGSRVEVSMVATAPLESLVERWAEAVGISRGIRDEAFGRSVLLTDPDGNPVQVNEPFAH